MAGFIQVPADGVGKRVDTVTLTDELAEVHRQKMVVTGGSGTAGVVVVTNAAPAAGDMGLVVRQAGTLTAVVTGTVNVNGGVAISGTAQVAIATPFTIQGISTTVQVAIATPYILQGISTTVTVAGNVNISATPSVILAAGTANFGTLNNISRTVQVAVGTPFTVNNISASVQVATGATADFAITATITQNVPLIGIAQSGDTGAVAWGGSVSVANNINISNTPSVILAAGAANFGTLNNISATVIVSGNVSISTTVQVAIATPYIIQGISTTVTVAGNVNISATAPVGIAYVTEKTTGSLVPVGDSANAAIRVNVVAGSSGGVSQVDGTTFSTQAANFIPIGGIFDDAASDTLSENDAGVVRVTTNRAFHVNLRTDGGAKLDDSANTALRVNVVAGGGAGGGTSMADRATFTPGTNATTPASGTYNTDDLATSISSGEVAAVRITSKRAFHVTLHTNSGTAVGDAAPLSVKLENASATVTVAGVVGLTAGAANIGFINHISSTVTVVGVVSLAAGSILDSISATVGVKGQVSLAAGTSNIGIINNISATVIVAMSNQTLQGISTTVTVTGVVNISNTPSVILAAGTANFGTLNDISRTVQVAIATPIGINSISATVTTVVRGFTPAVMAASHGPKCVTASTSSNVTLIASPGAGANIYVTQLMVGNFSGTLTRARIGTSASIATVVQPLAASGGGFVFNFDPPWMLTASEACVCSVKPNVADVFFTVNFFVI